VVLYLFYSDVLLVNILLNFFYFECYIFFISMVFEKVGNFLFCFGTSVLRTILFTPGFILLEETIAPASVWPEVVWLDRS
jgi:hypothetical protein